MESSGASAALDRSAEAKMGKLVQLLTLIRGLFDLSWDGLGWASNSALRRTSPRFSLSLPLYRYLCFFGHVPKNVFFSSEIF